MKASCPTVWMTVTRDSLTWFSWWSFTSWIVAYFPANSSNTVPGSPCEKETHRPWGAHMHLDSGAFLDKRFQCCCAFEEKRSTMKWTRLPESSMFTLWQQLCPYFCFSGETEVTIFCTTSPVLRIMCSCDWWTLLCLVYCHICPHITSCSFIS